MSGLNDLNGLFQFITKQNGKTATFSNINTDKKKKDKVDTDNDGKLEQVITQSEWDAAQNKFLFGVSFEDIDVNGDNYITKQEFNALRSSTQNLQNVVNQFKSVISNTFSGIDALLQQDAIDEIKDFVEAYISEFNGDVSEMDVDNFKTALQDKFNEMISDENGSFSKRPSTILSAVADSLYEQYTDNTMSQQVKDAIFNSLISVGEKFINKYDGELADLETKLTEYLEQYMSLSDSEKLKEETVAFKDAANSYGEQIDNNEFRLLKDEARTFLRAALDKNVDNLVLNGVRIKTTQAIESALAKYTKGVDLRNDMIELINNLSTMPKKDQLQNDPERIMNDIVEKLYNNYTQADGTKELDAELKSLIGDKLLEAAEAYYAEHKDDPDFADNLEKYLKNYMDSTDRQKLQSAVDEFNSLVGTLGNVITSTELVQLKDAAKTLLRKALSEGIEVTLGETKVTSANLNSVINAYTSGSQLKADLEAFINNLSDQTTIDKIKEDYAAKQEDQRQAEESEEAAAEREQNIAACQQCTVNPSLIDHSQIDNYNDPIGGLGNGNYRTKVLDFLKQDGLKNQMKEQVRAAAQASGIPASQLDKIMKVFENVYSSCVSQVMNAFTSGKLILSNGSAIEFGLTKITTPISTGFAIDTAQLVDGFIKLFNDKMQFTLSDMNFSDTDMDLQDLDYSEAYAYHSILGPSAQYGGSCALTGAVAEFAIGNMLETMKAQLKEKAIAMCSANGITFDENTFNTIYNNAKLEGIKAAKVTDSSVSPKAALEKMTSEFKTQYTAWVREQNTDAGDGESNGEYEKLSRNSTTLRNISSLARGRNWQNLI